MFGTKKTVLVLSETELNAALHDWSRETFGGGVVAFLDRAIDTEYPEQCIFISVNSEVGPLDRKALDKLFADTDFDVETEISNDHVWITLPEEISRGVIESLIRKHTGRRITTMQWWHDLELDGLIAFCDEDTDSLEVETPWGTLVAEKATDPQRPGIYTSFRRPDGIMIDLVGVETNEEEQRTSAYVWSDTSSEEWQHRYDFSQNELLRNID
jgi:ketosteroid isomerase-like protein